MKILFLVVSTIMVSGLLLGSMGTSVFAEHTDKPGKSMGCDNANEKSKVKEKNPHCVDEAIDSDNDGISDVDEIAAGNCLDPNNPDSDNDGWIDGSDAHPCDGSQH